MTEMRRDLLTRTAMQVLADAERPVPSGEVVAAVADRVTVNERERSLNNSGFPRYDTFVRFASGWMAGVGWVEKSREGWLLTTLGRVALAEIPAGQLERELGRRYRETLASRKRQSGGYSDPRWQTVATAVEAVPAGSWTTYGDVAELTGLSAQSIGTYMTRTVQPNPHRVLNASRTISPDFHWADPDRHDDPRVLLESEGVEFDAQGRASQAQRITAEELREAIGDDSAAGRRAWLVRGSAVSGVNVVPQWREDGFVSLAAAHLRPLASGGELDDLRAAVDRDYAHLSYNQRKAKVSELHAFLARMQTDDVVLTTADGRAYVGRITGEAAWLAGDPLTTIRRPVDWRSDGLDFTDLPESLQVKLRSSATVGDLTDVTDALERLLDDETAVSPAPHEANLPDLSSDVRRRLLVGAEWLDEFVDVLRERRQVILTGPPGTGKTFLALEVASALTDPANVKLVQFHPAYSYEDFFEGYRPTTVDDSGRVGFALMPGPFRKVVDQAREDPGRAYILVIDEINRANLAKVFGELYFLLEYRDRAIDLMYGSADEGRDFTLPKNVYLVGTMNAADRSISSIDAAMRRRFAFLSLHPDDAHLRGVLRDWLRREGHPTLGADLLDLLNERVPDRDAKIGPSYLMNDTAAHEGGLRRIWRTSILPLLEELHVGDGTDVERRYGVTALLRALPQPESPAEDEPTPPLETADSENAPT